MRRHLGVSSLLSDVHDGLDGGRDGFDELSESGRSRVGLLGHSGHSEEVTLGSKGLLKCSSLLADRGVQVLGDGHEGIHMGLDESIKLGDPLGQVGSSSSSSRGSSGGGSRSLNAGLGGSSVLRTPFVNMRLLRRGQVFKTRGGGFETVLVLFGVGKTGN